MGWWWLVGVGIGVVRFLGLCVEGGIVVVRADAPYGDRCGVAPGCGRREAVLERRAWGCALAMGVLVHFHASGIRGGPGMVVARSPDWPRARGPGFLLLVPATIGVSVGVQFPFLLVCRFSCEFFIGL